MDMEKIKIVFEALGEVSALFMSQDIRGVDMIMPSNEIAKIGYKMIDDLKNIENVTPPLRRNEKYI